MPVSWACNVLGVSVSGFYSWLRRGPSRRSQANVVLEQEVRRIHTASKKTYGSPRIWAELRAQGWRDSRGRVERLMRDWKIRGKQRMRHVVTTKAASDATFAPNLLDRRFKPGEVLAWVADITAIRTDEGFLYLAVVMDLADRAVLGWSTDDAASGHLALDALRIALAVRTPEPGTLHHSDRGGHYTADAYLRLLKQHGMQPSMSRKGNCYDNAVVESFFGSLKSEALYGIRLQTRKQAYRLVFEYIEGFYNRRRRHSTLGYLSPQEYARLTTSLL